MINNHCVACGQTGNLTHHHLVPRSLGGSDEESNLITLCGSCHAKAHQVQADWRHGELTSRAMQAKKAKGECTGSIPYGYRLAENGINLIENSAEQEAITQAQALRASGLSLCKVAAGLARQGIKTRNGSRFQATQIQRMVAIATRKQP